MSHGDLIKNRRRTRTISTINFYYINHQMLSKFSVSIIKIKIWKAKERPESLTDFAVTQQNFSNSG